MQRRSRKSAENILSGDTETGLSTTKLKARTYIRSSQHLAPDSRNVSRNITIYIGTIIVTLIIYFCIASPKINANDLIAMQEELDKLKLLLKESAKKKLSAEIELGKTKQQLVALTKEHESLNNTKNQSDIIDMQEELDKLKLILKDLKKELEETKQQLVALTEEHESLNNTQSQADNNEVEASYLSNVLKMREEVQQMSRREVLHKFGRGPYRIEISLDFPDSSGGGPSVFLLELAPLNLMPHSVYMFLQQVSHNLWNGCSFEFNAPHVIQTTTRSYVNTNEKKQSEFEELGLMSVSFQEYNEKFPHNKYSIGFSSRSNGPGWYISTKDNSRLHGPGGQKGGAYEFDTDADPCFGRVIDGFDAIDRVHSMPVRQGHKLLQRVGIKSARILGWSFMIQ